METLKNLLLIFGSLILCFSLRPIRKTLRPLPAGRVRFLWQLLFILVCCFIVGYLGYTLIFWGRYHNTVDLIVPLIFFLGSVFVLLACLLSQQTAEDLKRIFVLEQESTTDSLMGIYNRRYMERRLHEEFFRSLRYGLPLSLVMIDIDHFKKINDRWGHQVGDRVLKELAELIIATVRESDTVCRYGGEELLIILPHTDTRAALVMADNLRLLIEQQNLLESDRSRRQEPIRLTVSLGVAGLEANMESTHQLIGMADKALYYAKQRGRNRVECCPDMGHAAGRS